MALVLELAAQQTAGVIGYLTEPLLHGLALFIADIALLKGGGWGLFVTLLAVLFRVSGFWLFPLGLVVLSLRRWAVRIGSLWFVVAW